MTKKEFKTQKALGLIPENFELKFCRTCLTRKPHKVIHNGRAGNLFRCAECGKEKFVYFQF